MAAVEQYIHLAKALPLRLQRFLARYPPASILPAGADPETSKTAYQELTPNPFSPQKHPVTGKWHDPVFSLRRQAELVKLAREHGVEELLPKTVKGTEYQIAHRVEHGLRVKGTGVGQSVKGHAYERASIAKYVALVWSELWSTLVADRIAQDGEEERCHAEDARLDEGMEEGKCIAGLCGSWSRSSTNSKPRLASTGGRTSRNRRRAHGMLATPQSDRRSVYISCIINFRGERGLLFSPYSPQAWCFCLANCRSAASLTHSCEGRSPRSIFNTHRSSLSTAVFLF
jgi:large subunit ribosomal protein L25